MTEKVKVKVEVEVSFNSYPEKQQNKAAKRAILKWIEDTLKNECEYIPLYVEKDDSGGMIEDTTQNTKVKVKKNGIG